MAAIKIKSTHPESQGDFVLIEEEDFDAGKGHELLEPAAEPAAAAEPVSTKRGRRAAEPAAAAQE